jgi:predicted aspartyl protease
MAYQLNFARLSGYDPGKPGIMVPVTLRLTDYAATLEAKLDTGATECVFARQHGESLGLDIESGERLLINTATGTFTAFRHEVTMTVLDYAFDVRVCFAEDDQFNRNVLGRHGFLDRVRIGVVDYEGKLYLSRHDED